MASSILPISKKSTTWYRQRLVLVLLVIGVQLLLNFFYINKGVLFLSKTASCIQGTTGGTPPTSTSTNQTAAVSSTNTANISVSRSTDHIAVNAVKTTTNTGVRGTSTTTTIAPPDSSSSNTSCWNSDFLRRNLGQHDCRQLVGGG